MAISIKDIAKFANVSPSTVSFVINGKGDEFRISKETQRRVFDAAKNLGYRISEKKLLSAGQKFCMRVVMLVATRSSFSHYGSLFGSLQNALYELDYPIEISMQGYIPGKLSECNTLKGELCDGLIISGMNRADLAFLEQIDTEIPIVLYNCESNRFPKVICDDLSSAANIVNLFVSRGHSNICMITPLVDSEGFNRHLLGFANGCTSNNIGVSSIFFCEYSQEGGRQSVEHFLRCGATAIYATSYPIAMGILQELRAREIAVPDEIELISVNPNDSLPSDGSEITTLDMPVNEMLSTALKMLLDLKQKKQIEKRIVFPMNLTYRLTCPEVGKL